MKTLTFFALIASGLHSIPAGPQVTEPVKNQRPEIPIFIVDTVLLEIDERAMERNRLKTEYLKERNRAIEITDSLKSSKK